MENTFFGSKGNRTLVTIALLALILALSSYAYYAMKQAKYLYTGPVTISVTGEGEVMAVPDIGQFSFSVTASGTDAKQAQESSGKQINSILVFLKDKGVEEKDIKTENYNMYPRYKYETKPCLVNSYCPPGEQITDGFEVTQSISVKVRNLDNSGDLIAGVGDLGATNISNLQFTIDDTDALKAEARSKAIADAKAKKEALSKDLGVKFGKMTGFYENEGMPVPYYGGYGMGGEMDAMSVKSIESPSLPTGENTIKSQVTITYQVR